MQTQRHRDTEKRSIKKRRDEIAASIHKAKTDYRKGQVKKGTLVDLMKDLRL